MNHSDTVLKVNQEIRRTQLREMEAMQWSLPIPHADYKALLLLKPELDHYDAQARNLAWRSFIASDLSLPYRVRDHKSKVKSYE